MKACAKAAVNACFATVVNRKNMLQLWMTWYLILLFQFFFLAVRK